MKRLYLILIYVLMLQWEAMAQQYRFIYIQTENQQTFYVKLNDRHFSSSPTGYLIIPKLYDGTYHLEIGFPRNEYPTQQVKCVIDGRDAGYVLKNMGNESWALFNLSTMELSQANPGQITEAKEAAADESFEGKLSNVVGKDLKKSKRDKKKEQEVIAEPKPVALANTGVILKKEEVSGLNKHQWYEVQNDEKKETVEVIWEMSAKKIEEKQDKPAAPVKFIESSDKPRNNDVVMVNSNCTRHASEKDYLALRKKMAAESKDEKMLNHATKAFKKQCYSTAQLQGLVVLIQSEERKYEFLETAYKYVSDSNKFSSLKNVLQEEYYQRRFDALIRK